MADGDSGPHASLRPTTSTGWMVNWTGVIAIALVGVVALVAWRWIEGGDEAEGADGGRAAASAASSTVPTTAAPTTSVASQQAPTTVPPSTTTTIAPGRRVIISGEMKPCRFGENCLVASFRIEGFDPHPERFVCVYPNSTSDFGFLNDGVDDACLSGDQGDTIRIEVDGVSSATISEQNLDGSATE